MKRTYEGQLFPLPKHTLNRPTVKQDPSPIVKPTRFARFEPVVPTCSNMSDTKVPTSDGGSGSSHTPADSTIHPSDPGNTDGIPSNQVPPSTISPIPDIPGLPGPLPDLGNGLPPPSPYPNDDWVFPIIDPLPYNPPSKPPGATIPVTPWPVAPPPSHVRPVEPPPTHGQPFDPIDLLTPPWAGTDPSNPIDVIFNPVGTLIDVIGGGSHCIMM